MKINFGKSVCYFCAIEHDLKHLAEQESIKVGFNPFSKEGDRVIKKFMANQQQKCVLINTVSFCYEHLQSEIVNKLEDYLKKSNGK